MRPVSNFLIMQLSNSRKDKVKKSRKTEIIWRKYGKSGLSAPMAAICGAAACLNLGLSNHLKRVILNASISRTHQDRRFCND